MKLATDRKPRCRYTVHRGTSLDRCGGEATEEGGEIQMCTRHLGDAAAYLARYITNPDLDRAVALLAS